MPGGGDTYLTSFIVGDEEGEDDEDDDEHNADARRRRPDSENAVFSERNFVLR